MSISMEKVKLKSILCNVPILLVLALAASLVESSSIVLPDTPATQNATLAYKRNFVREMMKSSWDAYVKGGWPRDALRPVSLRPYENMYGPKSGLSIVNSLSTLKVMNLTEQFEVGRQWVRDELNFGQFNQDVWVYHSVVEYIGGLLSAYALSGDEMFVQKAKQVAEALGPAYNSSSGIPKIQINPKTGFTPGPLLSSIPLTNLLSWAGGQQLEYAYLSNLTSEPKYLDRALKVRAQLIKAPKPDGLYREELTLDGNFTENSYASLYRKTRDFYQTLVKSYLQTNGRDREAIEVFRSAIFTVLNGTLIVKSKQNNMTFVRKIIDVASPKSADRTDMEQEACYLGSMFVLGSNASLRALKMEQSSNTSFSAWDALADSINAVAWLYVGANITETCNEAAVQTSTGLPPATFYFDMPPHRDASNTRSSGQEYNLSPELAESNFVLWRLTHDQRYRDAAWRMVQALYNHARVEQGGYSNIANVNKVPTEKRDLQQSEFLSATLKYLYLTFADDSVLPHNDWVFNAYGHPLPVLK